MNVLVIALDAGGPLEVRDAEVLVVAPAVNSRLRRWLSDDDQARRVAEERLAACVDRLERAVVHASGRVGDADPVQAIADALATFAADQVMIAAHPGRSSGLGRDVARRARSRFRLPIVDAGDRKADDRRRSRGPESPSFPF
jgi:nucleotide-binding universal stress UspA family protein